MSRKYKKYYRSHKLTKFEQFQLGVFLFVLFSAFIGIFAWRFVTNCVFHWPIKFDLGTCWSEQIEPAKEGAIEKASPFMPDIKI